MRSSLALVTCVLAAACGSEPAAPRPAPDPVEVRIAPAHRAHTPAGGTVLLAASAYDADGSWVALDPAAFHWTSTGPVSVAPHPRPPRGPPGRGVGDGRPRGGGWVSVEVDGAGRDSVPVQVFVPSEDVFDIVLVYADGLPERWRSFLEAAARRWEATMAGELPEVELDLAGGDCDHRYQQANKEITCAGSLPS